VIVRRFLLWARTASAGDRAEGARALAQAYLHGAMAPEDRREAETAMLSLLDDPSALVRRALAEVLATQQAPRAVILGLAQDQPDIAALVLMASPMLTEADLVDAVAIGGELAQSAVAMRADVGVALAAAIVEVGTPVAVRTLLGNHAAMISSTTLQRAADRLGSEPSVREALLARDELPASIRHQIALEVAQSLSAWAGSCGFMSPERAERVARESSEKVALDLAQRSDGFEAELMALIAQLRRSNRLTPGLILRSLLTGETALAEAALGDLAGMPLSRAASILHDRRGSGVSALCRKAQIPAVLVPAFVAAVEAVREIGAPRTPSARAATMRRIVERVLIACEAGDEADNAALMALLRRYEAEAAREEAQEAARMLADDAALAALIEIDPELLLLQDLGPMPLAA
jgi:uncharacterized protein (DUF2336 family)